MKESDQASLTLEEQVTNAATWHHIHRVGTLLRRVIHQLLDRMGLHDASKLEPPEVAVFTEYTKKLKDLDYGSDAYRQCLAEMKPALDHHYQYNRHHPGYFPNGINDMTLIDLIEMLCDWKAASERHETGNIQTSIEHNAKRFGIDPQLTAILLNSVPMLSPVGGIPDFMKHHNKSWIPGQGFRKVNQRSGNEPNQQVSS